jgi:predicted N-acetyltransferase YhbS
MFAIALERPEEAAAIESLLDRAFGPGRLAKTSYRLREGVFPLAELCFALRVSGALRGAIRYWPVLLGGRKPALLLGPLAVAPEDKGKGYGVALMRHSLAAAARLGHERVILVGDPEYYDRFGFKRRFAEGLNLPGPVEERRFLGLELVPGAFEGVGGPVGPARRKAA